MNPSQAIRKRLFTADIARNLCHQINKSYNECKHAHSLVLSLDEQLCAITRPFVNFSLQDLQVQIFAASADFFFFSAFQQYCDKQSREHASLTT